MSPIVVPRGARASGSSVLGAGCNVWPQSCADVSEPEGRGWTSGVHSIPSTPNSHPFNRSRPSDCPQAPPMPLAIQAPLAHQKQSQLPPFARTHVLPCREGVGLSSMAHTSGHAPPPGLFPTLSSAPGPPYPHSRGSPARVLPGRSGGQTDTSLPLPPIGYKTRLVRERDEGRGHCFPWPCNLALPGFPPQRPHQILPHLPPAVRRPPATASPLEDPLLPSHGGTCGGSARPGVRTNSLHSSIPEPSSPPPAAGARVDTPPALTGAAGASAAGRCLGWT